MPQGQSLVRTAAGIFSQYNKLNAIPPGALSQCQNGVIDREGIISKRRGLKRYGTTLSNPPSGLYEYLKTLVVKDGSTLKYDSDGAGAWASWAGTFSPPDSSIRINSLESNNNFYFTTSQGVYKNDALTGAPVRAGMPQGLDIALNLLDTSPTWFKTAGQVGYRILWGRIDAKNNTILGAPSFQEIVSNSSGVSKSVDLVFTIPNGVLAGDFYEIYRTNQSANVSTPPSDRHYKLNRVVVTAGDISVGTISFSDHADDSPTNSFLGAELYTNDLQETIAQANDRPPFAKHFALYKGHIFYGNFLREHQSNITLTSVAGVTDNTDTFKITIGSTVLTYTYGTVESIGFHKFQRFNTGVLGTDLRNTAKSLVRVINRDTSNSLVYAHYTSGVDEEPGKILIKTRDLNGSAFSLNASLTGGTTDGTNFTPNLPKTGATVLSTNDASSYRVARSKFQKPEAVPGLNVMEIGRANQAILGMATLKHGLMVWKEDGIFIISGETDGGGGFNFVVDSVDPTIKLLAPSSLVTLDNAVFGYTTQGVVRAFEGGSGIVSRPIELDLNPIAQSTLFSSITHAVAYESDRKYLLFVPETTSDLTPKICYVFNYLTNAWTLWNKNVACGLVLSSNQTLYLGHAVDNFVLQERKSYLRSNQDYVDETIDVTVTAKGTATYLGETVTTVTVSYSYSQSMSSGWLFESNSWSGKVVAVVNNGGGSYTLTLGTLLTLATPPFTAQMSIPIDLLVEWAPLAGENVGAMKQFSMVQFYQEEDFALVNEVGFFADTQAQTEWVNPADIGRSRGWGQGYWGTSPWGDEQEGKSTPLRVPVPRNHQRCRALRVYYRHRTAKEAVNILQLSVDMRDYGTRTKV